VALIEFPDELDVLHEYWPPEVGALYWVSRDVFGRPDEKPKRPYVVVALPAAGEADLIVVRRSTSARTGVFHDAHPEVDLKQGWFCEVRNANTELWTVSTVSEVGLFLTEEELAYVMRLFL
jgi:hypothetical protein